MDDFERLLRSELREESTHLVPRHGLARVTWRRGRQTHRLQQAGGAMAVAVTVTATVGGGVLIRERGDTSGTHLPTTGQSGGPSQICPSPRDLVPRSAVATELPAAGVASPPTASNSTPSAALRAVHLPNPAPGFAVRRGNDTLLATGFGNSTYWVATFLVAQQPLGQSATPATSGSTEAAVLVIDGAPFDLDAGVRKIRGAKVSGTAEIQGQTAYVTHSCGLTAMYFHAGEFQVTLTGLNTTVEQLVTLGDSLEGLERVAHH